jgi:hypothetical protein
VVALIVEHHLKLNQGEGAMLTGGRAWASGKARAGGGSVRFARGLGDGREKRTNRYLHNQWQVGNFVTQKQLKAGGLLSSLCYAKAAFGCDFG